MVENDSLGRFSIISLMTMMIMIIMNNGIMPGTNLVTCKTLLNVLDKLFKFIKKPYKAVTTLIFTLDKGTTAS